jgi:hypothetical protein
VAGELVAGLVGALGVVFAPFLIIIFIFIILLLSFREA